MKLSKMKIVIQVVSEDSGKVLVGHTRRFGKDMDDLPVGEQTERFVDQLYQAAEHTKHQALRFNLLKEEESEFFAKAEAREADGVHLTTKESGK